MNLNLEHVRVPAGLVFTSPSPCSAVSLPLLRLTPKTGATPPALQLLFASRCVVCPGYRTMACAHRVPVPVCVRHCSCVTASATRMLAVDAQSVSPASLLPSKTPRRCVWLRVCVAVCVCVCVAVCARVCVTDAHTRATDAAPQSAVTDGRKRALRLFGPRLGNCLANKDHVRSVNATSQQMLQKKHARPSVTVVGTPCSTHDHSYPDLPMHCAWYRRRGSPLTSASVSTKRQRPRMGPAPALAPVQQRPAIQTQLAPTA